MKKHRFSPILGILLCALAIASCRPEGNSGDPKDGSQDTIPVNGDWIRINHSSDPDGLSPYNTRSGSATNIRENIHMSLMSYNSHSLLQEPNLVVGPPQISADGLRFTYEMRPEARWDNGDPVTGNDYAFSLKCIKNPLTNNAHMKANYEFITDVQVDPANPRKFTVVTTEPYFLATTSIPDIDIISQKFYDSLNVLGKYAVTDFVARPEEIAKDPAIIAFSESFNSDKYATNPAFIYGAGAYKVESWTPGDNVTLVRKKDWWGDKLRGKAQIFQGYPEKLIYKTIKDKATYPAVARSGELDVVTEMSADDFVAAKEDTAGYLYQHFNFYTPSTYSTLYLGFNCKPGPNRKPVLEDPRVRKAISHLTNTESIIAEVYNGMGQPQVGPISPLHEDEYDHSQTGYPFDPAKAKVLLDEAGWIDSDADGIRDKVIKGKKIKLEIELILSNSGETGKRLARMIADQALKAGVKININPIDFSTLNDRMRQHDFDMALNGMGGAPIPSDLSQYWLSENWGNGGSNTFGFGDSTTDALIAQIRHTTVAADRTPLYHRFVALWLDQLPVVPLIALQTRLLIAKRIHNARPSVVRPGFKPMEFWVPKTQQKFK